MNENNNPFNSIMETVLGNIKQMVDVNTIVGDPIVCGDGTTIIPVSKVTFGFASGGADMNKPATPVNGALFGIGNGAGVTISPIAFLVVANGNVRLLPVSGENNTIGKLVDSAPEIIDKVNGIVKDYVKKDKKDEDE